jgi:UDP-glucose:(heptosyl)LPS alpha-1,3-glucosyltransferase
VKIALVILHADASRGGAERYTLDLADALVERGHDVSIVASSFQARPVAGRSLKIDAWGLTRTRRYMRFLDELHLVLADNRFDVVHAMLPVRPGQCDIYHPHAGIASAAVLEGHFNKSGEIKRWLSRLGNRFNSRRNRFAAIERDLLTQVNAPIVLCLSNLIKAVVQRHYPTLAADRLVPLFNGVDLKRFDPRKDTQARQRIRNRFNVPHNTRMALMLAQDFERKGLAEAIQAFSRIGNPKLYLLVGGRPDTSTYRRLAESLGIAHRIIFAGGVENPVEFYQAADFFILPTRFDPCSLVVLEALAMGLPVISTSRNGACEVMADGVHGRVLTDPHDISALANAIREMDNPVSLERFGSACMALRSTLSQQKHVSSVEKFYLQLCEAKQPRLVV